MKTSAEYQRARRARLQTDGSTCRLQSEISSAAGLALIHLSTVREQPARVVLEHLIMEAITHAAA